MKNVLKRPSEESPQISRQWSSNPPMSWGDVTDLVQEVARLRDEIDHYKGVIIYTARRTVDDWARGFLESNYEYPEQPDKGASS
jgi:hypothetical protein